MTAPVKSGGELFIVDNSETEWKGLRYLQDWTEIASAFDIATGFFEIGSLLALDGKWQKLDKMRILMGDQATARTRQAILEGLRQHVCQKLDASLEGEKESNDLLAGAAATRPEAETRGGFPSIWVLRLPGLIADQLSPPGRTACQRAFHPFCRKPPGRFSACARRCRHREAGMGQGAPNKAP